MRFGLVAKILVTTVYIIQMTFYVAASFLAASIAFAAVTGTEIIYIVIGIGLLTVVYTSLGGLKAVVWTDLIQLTIMLVGLLFVLIYGLVSIGGPKNMWSQTNADGKLFQLSFGFNPFVRYSFWTLTVGSIGAYLTTQAANQAQVQRYLACKSLKVAKTAILMNIPVNIALHSLHACIGLVSYVYFRGCDPFLSGKISRIDMLFPQLILELFNGIPVFRGLFVAVVMAAGLSTISSGLNSLILVFVNDVFLPVMRKVRPGKELRQKTMVILSITFSFALGVITICIAVGLGYANPNILRIVFNMFGAFGSPIFALLTIGIFFPYINNWGGTIGFLLSVVGSTWMAIGNLLRNTVADIPGAKPSIVNCTFPVTVPTFPPAPTGFSFYDLSFLYLTLVALVLAFVFGSLVSLISGMNSNSPVRQSLMASQAVTMYAYISKCLPVQSFDDNANYESNEDSYWEKESDSTFEKTIISVY